MGRIEEKYRVMQCPQGYRSRKLLQPLGIVLVLICNDKETFDFLMAVAATEVYHSISPPRQSREMQVWS